METRTRSSRWLAMWFLGHCIPRRVATALPANVSAIVHVALVAALLCPVNGAFAARTPFLTAPGRSLSREGLPGMSAAGVIPTAADVRGVVAPGYASSTPGYASFAVGGAALRSATVYQGSGSRPRRYEGGASNGGHVRGGGTDSGYPFHDLRLAVAEDGTISAVDRMVIFHPGGEGCMLRFGIGSAFSLHSVRWRSSTLPFRLAGAGRSGPQKGSPAGRRVGRRREDSLRAAGDESYRTGGAGAGTTGPQRDRKGRGGRRRRRRKRDGTGVRRYTVELPYQSIPAEMELELRYRGRVAVSGGMVLLDGNVRWIPVLEGADAVVRTRVKLPQGWDLVSSAAPEKRIPGRNGSLLCRLPSTRGAYGPVFVAGPLAVESLPLDYCRVEVAARGLDEAREAAATVERVIRGLRFLAGPEESYSVLIAEDPDIPGNSVPHLALVRPAESYLAPTADETARAVASMMWTSSFDWADGRKDRMILDGLVKYCSTVLLARRRSSARFRETLEQVENALRRTRPAPRWRRWRGKPVAGEDRGFGLFYMLRGILGGREFSEALHGFARQSRRRGRASAALLLELLSRGEMKPPDWLFSSFLEAGFLPDLYVDSVSVNEVRRPVEMLYDKYGTPSGAGRYFSEIKLVQGGEFRFRGKVGLRIVTDMEHLDTIVEMDGRTKTIQVMTARPPRKVIVDPGRRLIEANEKNNELVLYRSPSSRSHDPAGNLGG